MSYLKQYSYTTEYFAGTRVNRCYIVCILFVECNLNVRQLFVPLLIQFIRLLIILNEIQMIHHLPLSIQRDKFYNVIQ